MCIVYTETPEQQMPGHLPTADTLRQAPNKDFSFFPTMLRVGDGRVDSVHRQEAWNYEQWQLITLNFDRLFNPEGQDFNNQIRLDRSAD